MDPSVKKVWLAQLAYPAIQYGALVLAAYINIYWLENYDRKFDKAGAFAFDRSLIAFVAAISSVLYSITFFANVRSIWNQVRSASWFALSLPIAVSALIQVGLFFPLQKLGNGVGLVPWLFLIPPALAWLSIKFLSEEGQSEAC